MADKPSVKSLPSLQPFEALRDSIYDRASLIAEEEGMTLEEFEAEVPFIRKQVVDVAFEDFPRELGYQEWEIAAGLRSVGFKDLVSEDLLPRAEVPDKAQMLAEIKEEAFRGSTQMREVAQQIDPDKQDNPFTKFLTSYGKGLIETQASQQRAAETASRVAPRLSASTVTASWNMLSNLQELSIEAGLRGENPGKFMEQSFKEDLERTAWRVPGYELIGVEPLTEKGVPHWLADFLVEDFLDPVSWVFQYPIGLDMLQGGMRLTGKAARSAIRRSPWSAARGVELAGNDLMVVLDSTQDAIRKSFDLDTPNAGQRITLDKALEGLPGEGEVTDIFLSFANKVKKKAGDIEQSRADVEAEFFTRVGDLSRKNPEGAMELLDLRIGMASTSDEVQSIVQKVLRNEDLAKVVDPEVLRRKDLKIWVYKEGMEDFEQVEGGLFQEFIHNPTRFYDPESGELKKGFEKFGKLLGENLAEAQKSMGKIRIMGQTKGVREGTASLEELFTTNPDEFGSIVQKAGGLERIIDLSKTRLERTAAFRPLHFADRARQLEHQLTMAKAHALSGGRARLMGDDIIGAALGKDLNLQLINPHPMLKGRPSIMGLLFNRNKIRVERAQAIDANHRLSILLGDERHLESVEMARERLGLDPVVINEADRIMAENMRVLWDELGEEAVRLGLVDPQALLQDYLPRIQGFVDDGLTHEEAVEKLERMYLSGNPKYVEEGLPSFSYIRSGELEGELLTNHMALLDMYSKTLYRQKYIKPVLKDVVDNATNPKLNISIQDREFMLDFAHHVSGGKSRQQRNMRAILDSGDDPEMRAKFYQEHENAFLESLDVDQNEVTNFFNWFSRQAADAWFMQYLGGNIGKPMRNLTQQSLGIPMMGGSIKGWNNLSAGAKRMLTDETMQSAYRASERRWGWNSGFLDFAAQELETSLPDFISRHTRDKYLRLYSVSDNVNRRNTWAGAVQFFEQELPKVKAGKKHGLFEGARTFDVEERATLKRLLKKERYDEAMAHYADAVVNNSQWLYTFKNRPLWAQDHRLAGNLLLFQTWGMNYATMLRRGVGRNPLEGANTLRRTPIAKQIINGQKYMMPWMMMAVMTEMAGRSVGVGAGDYMLPDLDNIPKVGQRMKKNLGFHKDDRTLAPIPKGVNDLFRTVEGFGDPAQGGPIFWNWVVKSFEGAAKMPFNETRARGLHEFLKAQPRPFDSALGPVWSELGKAMGISPEVDLRDGLGEQVLGAILQVSTDDFVSAVKRKQGIPGLSKTGEDRILFEDFINSEILR